MSKVRFIFCAQIGTTKDSFGQKKCSGDDVKGLLTMAHSFAVISHEYYFGTGSKINFYGPHIYSARADGLSGRTSPFMFVRRTLILRTPLPFWL